MQHPVISDPALKSIVKVSGFDINELRVSYTAADDTLSVGIAQPLSQQPTHPGPVIAGDSDNNGDDGTVSQAVIDLEGTGFKDFPDFGGSEFMAAFLDLKGSGFADVAAGYAINDPRSPKQYQVAEAVVNSTPGPNPLDFGTGQVQEPGTVYQEVPASEGNVYKVNSPKHPNLEFAITHFSQLYLAETGKPLTPSSVIGMGATAGSGDTPGISKAFFPEQKFTLAQATIPPTVCPPASPPVIINPHANQHINTAHDTLIRVNVLGSSGFDVSKIEPQTVTLGGAHPVFSFDHFINKDNWPDATFVFRGSDVHLPAGYTEATVSGDLTDGTMFSSSVRVFNRDSSFYSPAAAQGAQVRQSARTASGDTAAVLPSTSPVTVVGSTPVLTRKTYAPNSPNGQLVGSTLKVDYTTPAAVAAQSIGVSTHAHVVQHGQPEPAGKVVSIKRHKKSHVTLASTRNKNIDRFVRQVGAVNLATGKAVGGAGVSPRYVREVGAVNLTTNTPIGPSVSTQQVRSNGAVNLTTNTPIGTGAA